MAHHPGFFESAGQFIDNSFSAAGKATKSGLERMGEAQLASAQAEQQANLAAAKTIGSGLKSAGRAGLKAMQAMGNAEIAAAQATVNFVAPKAEAAPADAHHQSRTAHHHHHGRHHGRHSLKAHHATAASTSTAPTPDQLTGADKEMYNLTHGPNAMDPNAAELKMAAEGKQSQFGEHLTGNKAPAATAAAAPAPDVAKTTTQKASPQRRFPAPGMGGPSMMA